MPDQNNLKKMSIPFTGYDFYGYLIPGATFLFSIYAFEYLARTIKFSDLRARTPFWATINSLTLSKSNLSWSTETIYIVALAIMAYVAGHIIGSASSFLYDRILIAKGYGYPYRWFLRLIKGEVAENSSFITEYKFSREFYKGIVFWIYFASIFIYFVYFVSRRDWKINYSIFPNNATPITLGVVVLAIGIMELAALRAIRRLRPELYPSRRNILYVGMFIIAVLWILYSFHYLHALLLFLVYLFPGFIISSIVLKLYITNNALYWVRRHNMRYISGANRFIYRIAAVFSKYYAYPYNIMAKLISSWISSKSAFSEDMITKYKNQFEKYFGVSCEEAETDNHWSCFFFVRTFSPSLSVMISNWHRLYSFARNLAMAFFASFLYFFCWQYVYRDSLNYNAPQMMAIFMVTVAYYIASIIMIFRYYYLYTHYYTRELLRAFTFLSSSEIQKLTSSGDDANDFKIKNIQNAPCETRCLVCPMKHQKCDFSRLR